jgi:hypothetical protein
MFLVLLLGHRSALHPQHTPQVCVCGRIPHAAAASVLPSSFCFRLLLLLWLPPLLLLLLLLLLAAPEPAPPAAAWVCKGVADGWQQGVAHHRESLEGPVERGWEQGTAEVRVVAEEWQERKHGQDSSEGL